MTRIKNNAEYRFRRWMDRHTSDATLAKTPQEIRELLKDAYLDAYEEAYSAALETLEKKR